MLKVDKHALFAIAAIAVLLALFIRWWPGEDPAFVIAESIPAGEEPLYFDQVISFGETAAVHAPAITTLDNGKLMAVWYAGSREGAKDVRIDSTIIDPVTHTISPPRAIAKRDQTAKDTWRYIRKLGNPVIHQMADGRLMMMYVSVSFGGWAASNLNVRFSDDGRRWGQAIRLVTSPFLNLSTLVKGTPLNLDNGNVAIPVYHEFFGKFGELLIMDPHGGVVSKHRMSWGRDAIQPVVVPVSANKAIALLRDSGERHKRVGFSMSEDTGQSWATPEPLELPNPNAAVAASMTSDNAIIMVFNNHEDERNDLTLAISRDQGRQWKIVHEFENDPLVPGEKIEFSYPYLLRDRQGDFHLLYTWHKKRIKYIHFNEAWLRQLQ